jgi:hypothetical protein
MHLVGDARPRDELVRAVLDANVYVSAALHPLVRQGAFSNASSATGHLHDCLAGDRRRDVAR